MLTAGKYQEGEQPEIDALLRLEKSPFDEKSIEKYLTEATKLELAFQNDVYCQYRAIADPELNNLKAVTIMPATEKHFLKYTEQEYYVVNETPKDYDEITLPYIKENQHSLQVSWQFYFVYFVLIDSSKRNLWCAFFGKE